MIKKLWAFGLLLALPGLYIFADKHGAEEASAHEQYVKIFKED